MIYGNLFLAVQTKCVGLSADRATASEVLLHYTADRKVKFKGLWRAHLQKIA